MKSRTLPAILTLALVAETCAIAYLLYTRNNDLPSDPPQRIRHEEMMAKNERLETENASLKKALASSHSTRAPRGSIDTKNIPSRITDALAAPSDDSTQNKWQRLATMQNTTGMDSGIFVTERPFDSSNAKLSPAFMTLFEITPEEQAALEKTLAAARDQVNELTMKNAVTRTLPDGSFEIKVNAFPETGGAAYDQLHDQFRNTLGADRYAAMNAISGRALDMSFSNFGAENRTVTISREEDGGANIKDVGEHEGSRRMSMSKTPNMDIARQHLGNLATLLPPDF